VVDAGLLTSILASSWPGVVPAIHVLLELISGGGVDARDKPGHGERQHVANWLTARRIIGEGVGGARRDRTADLVIANDALSQLSYGPLIGRAGYGGGGQERPFTIPIMAKSRTPKINVFGAYSGKREAVL
jgi:hypothetical protein